MSSNLFNARIHSLPKGNSVGLFDIPKVGRHKNNAFYQMMSTVVYHNSMQLMLSMLIVMPRDSIMVVCLVVLHQSNLVLCLEVRYNLLETMKIICILSLIECEFQDHI